MKYIKLFENYVVGSVKNPFKYSNNTEIEDDVPEVDVDTSHKEPFDLNIFKELKNSRAKAKYLRENLEPFMYDNYRWSYYLPDGNIIFMNKMGKYAMHLHIINAQDSHPDVVAKVLDYDKYYQWMITEPLKKASDSRIFELLGLHNISEFLVYKLGDIICHDLLFRNKPYKPMDSDDMVMYNNPIIRRMSDAHQKFPSKEYNHYNIFRLFLSEVERDGKPTLVLNSI